MERKKAEDKTLVVTQKEFYDQVRKLIDESGCMGIEVAYFGDIIGKNDWREFSQVWLIASSNYQMNNYALRWSLASGKSLRERDLRFFTGTGKMCFVDPEIEKVRLGCTVSDLYQAIKRINRDNTRSAEVYVVTADAEIVTMLQKQLWNIQHGGQIALDVKVKNAAPKKKSTYDRLAETLARLPVGDTPKSLVCEEVGINKANFSRYLKDARVQSVVDARKITTSGRTLHVAV